MATPTYDLIASTVLGSTSASVTFSSISGSFRDLVLVADYVSTGTSVNTSVRFNSDSGGNYSYLFAGGDGSSTVNESQSNNDRLALVEAANADAGERTMSVLQIMDYSTSKHKTTLTRSDAPTDGTEMSAGRWANTSAINSILIYSVSQSFAAGSTFYLYGIAG